jgi:hypothetical protein
VVYLSSTRRGWNRRYAAIVGAGRLRICGEYDFSGLIPKVTNLLGEVMAWRRGTSPPAKGAAGISADVIRPERKGTVLV